jgi:regulator of sigma E protease
MNSSLPPSTEKAVPPDATESKSTERHRSVFTNFRFWGFLGFFVIFLVPYGIYHGWSSFFFGLITFLEVVLLFNILIIVHELGHFLAAKWCGLKIDKFAIWFGKPIWSKKVNGVDYILGSIPAGGYVALPQMAPMEAVEGKSDTPREELPPASPWQKIVVAFAGPLFSFGLALTFACIVWMVGRPVTYSEKTTVVGYVKPGGPADVAGIKPGDAIQSIDGYPVHKFFGNGDSIVWRVVSSTNPTIEIGLSRDGVSKTIEVVPFLEKPTFWQRAPIRQLLISPAEKELVVAKVLPNSPGALAGLQPGDKIVAMNGQKLYTETQIGGQIEDHPKDPFRLTVQRKGSTFETKMVAAIPAEPKGIKDPLIGIEWADPAVELVYPNPAQQVVDSANAVVSTLSALFAPHSHVGASRLSGPVGIMYLFFAVLSSPDGWRLALWLAVLINVNLAMLNLFPLPVLDGGHILLSIVEWIRRRPLSMAILEPIQTTFALLLIGYMLYITFFDAQDAGKMALDSSGGEIKFAPKAATSP